MKQPIIDNDKALSYETNSPVRIVTNFFLIPALNLLPRSIQPLLKKSHKSGKEIIEHATTHKALEILYGHGSAKVGGSNTQNFFKSIWLSTNNSKAVRNRLKLVKRELTKNINRLLDEKRKINIISIASGSARAILESVQDSKISNVSELSVTFIDKNSDAIEYSKLLTKDNVYYPSFSWVCETANSFLNSRSADVKSNIVEMVGLIDYFDDEKALRIFSNIYKTLEHGGVFITANIDDNSERPFITKAVGWNMIYRSYEDLARLVIQAGFDEKKMDIFYEPQKIHSVIVAQK